MICFKLISKATGETQTLNNIDIEICQVMGVEVHPVQYGGNVFNWFDTIGFQIASGKELGSTELRDHYLKSEMWAEKAPMIEKILDYLEANYRSNSFYARKADV